MKATKTASFTALTPSTPNLLVLVFLEVGSGKWKWKWEVEVEVEVESGARNPPQDLSFKDQCEDSQRQTHGSLPITCPLPPALCFHLHILRTHNSCYSPVFGKSFYQKRLA